MKYFKYISIVVFLFSATSNYAQQEEVKVVKPYNPTLTGAEKIQLLPRINDSASYAQPKFEYSIISKRYETDYQLTPIQAARMVRTPLEKLYKSEVKIGGGNYLTPLAELRINQVRSTKATYGFWLKHHSMNGKVKLANDEKVAAGFNENKLELYGKKFAPRSIFEYGVGASYNIYQHYGVDTMFADSVNKTDMQHPFFHAHSIIGIQSAYPDSLHLNYNGTLEYNYFTHNFDQMEHDLVLDGSLNKELKSFKLGSDLGIEFIGHQASWDTLVGNYFLVKLNPYISQSSSEWMYRVGINSYTEIRNGEVIPHFYFRGQFSFNIVKDVLVPYFGADGYRKTNSYMELTAENPYIVPGLLVQPTNYKLILYSGLKGSISDLLAWNVKGSISVVDDQYFFASDTSNYLNNQFIALYDDMTVMNVYGELNIAPESSLRLLIKGNYYYYQMVREAYAWYKPDFDLGLQARYNIGDKILADAGLFVIGPRYFPSLTENGNHGMLKTSLDVNMGLEYRYTKLLSFWAKFNNITAQPYYMWNNYPSYRFRFMLGFTYGL